MRELLAHPAHLVEPIPDSISDEAAVVLEPMAIALHAVNLVKPRLSTTAVILGTGVLGACVLSILRLFRGVRIVCADIMPDRLERAKRLGADEVILADPHQPGEACDKIKRTAGPYGADLVFECAGERDTLYNMCEIAAPGDKVAVIGTSPDDLVSFASSSARRKGLTLIFVRRSLNTLRDVINLASHGLIAPDQLVTHIMRPSESCKAFDLADSRADGVLKAIIDLERF